jgi:hypothetical protein
MFAAQLAELVKRAENDSDPALYAMFILDNVAEAQVRAFIERPDALAELIRVNPAVNDHLEWFAELRSHLIGLMGVPPSEASASGDLTHTQVGANNSDDADRPGAANVFGAAT